MSITEAELWTEDIPISVLPDVFEESLKVATFIWEFDKLPVNENFINRCTFKTNLCNEEKNWNFFINYKVDTSPILFVLMHEGRSIFSIHPILKTTFYKGQNVYASVENDDPKSSVNGHWDTWEYKLVKNDTNPTINMIIKEFNCRLKIEIKIVYDILTTNYMKDLWEFREKGPFVNFAKTLEERQKNADLIIKADGEEFYVERNILGMRSQVFFTLFKYDDYENTCYFSIDGVNSKAVYEMLCYLYTGKSKNMKNYVYDLLLLADRYKIMTLKEDCESMISQNLKLTSLKKSIEIAKKYELKGLENDIKTYINNTLTKEFRETCNLDLLGEVVSGLHRVFNT